MKATYKTLIVWQKSMDLVEFIYRTTRTFPDDEKFNLVSQMRRCGVSIPSNIAEGHGRKTNGEFVHFMNIAFGSTSELETQLEIAYRLKMINDNDYLFATDQLTFIRKMLNSLIKSTKQKIL